MDTKFRRRGQHTKLTEAQLQRAAKYREDGLADNQIGRQLGVSGHYIAKHLGKRPKVMGIDAKAPHAIDMGRLLLKSAFVGPPGGARIMAKRYGIPIEEAVIHYENNEWYCKTCKSWKSEPKVTMRKCERCRNATI